MKRITLNSLLAVGILCLGNSSGYAATIGGPVSNPANGHVYFLVSQNIWAPSEAEALGLGGHLATINNQAENDWVFSTFSMYEGVPRALWIGLTDQQQEGAFVWSSGEPLGYTHWGSGQPDNGAGGTSEQYVHMLPPGHPYAGYWNDFQELPTVLGAPLSGVVEVVPEPSTVALVLAGLGFAIRAKRRDKRTLDQPSGHEPS